MSEDPIGFAGGDYNLYRYVLNNPMKETDPRGLNSSIDLINGIDNSFDLIGAVSGSEGAAVGALVGGIVAGIPGSIAGSVIGGQFGPNPSLDPSQGNPNDPRFTPAKKPFDPLPPLPPLKNPPSGNQNVCTQK